MDQRADAAGRQAIDVTREVLAEVLPIRGGAYALEPARDLRGERASEVVFEAGRRGIVAVLQLFVWEIGDGGQRSVRDIKEQEVSLVPPEANADPGRVEPYLRGWAAAVREVFERCESEAIDCAMPHDLCNHRVLSLKRPREAADFQAALLVPSRLGRLLQAPARRR